jgi:hypothetical protein
MEIYEGTSTMKEAKLYVYKGKFNEFTMKKDEDVSTMFNRLNDIVNEHKCLYFDVTNKDLSHKFLRCLSGKYETIVTLLVRSDLKKMTPTEVLGEVLTHDLFKQSQKEGQGESTNEEKKNIALNAKVTQEEEDGKNQEIDSDEEMDLILKGLKRIMNKSKFGKKGQSSKKNPFLRVKIASIVVRLDIYQLIVQTRKKTNMARRRTRKMCKSGINILRRRRVAKPILLSGITMQASMKMMMTGLQRVLLGCYQGSSITLLQAILSHGKR